MSDDKTKPSTEGKLLDFRGRELRPIFPVETKREHKSGRRAGRRVVDFAERRSEQLTDREQRALDEAHAVVLAQTNAGTSRDVATIAGYRQIQRRKRLAWALAWRFVQLFVCTWRGHSEIKIREDSTMLDDPTRSGRSGAFGETRRRFVCLRCFEPRTEVERHA